MTRLVVCMSALIGSAIVGLTSTGDRLPAGCREVLPAEAASVRGGDCGAYQKLAGWSTLISVLDSAHQTNLIWIAKLCGAGS
jgi:hypothetical protein